MVKVKVKQNISNKPKFILMIIGFTVLLLFIFFAMDKVKNIFGNSNNSSAHISSEMGSILSKQENLLTIEEWQKLADYRAQEFYECTKDLDMDITKWYLYEDCARTYNNAWVYFRDGLDQRANLNYDQGKVLKDYWHKTSEAMIDKISEVMEANDRELRPNKY